VVNRLAIAESDKKEVRDAKKAFLGEFITATDEALEHIHPETDVHHQEIALLMGRPMAVVRATVALQIKGGLPVHHGWDPFITDLRREKRETNEIERVNVPVRLGERYRLNDGLVGYWPEDAKQNLERTFYTTGNESDSHDLQLRLDTSSHKTLTLLVDPRGDVHATTGMLPVKSIHIPRTMYSPALKNINITFLASPIVTGMDQVALPLPVEMGYKWSWLAKERFAWKEIAQTGIVRKDDVFQKFDDPEGLWKHLLKKGWLLELAGNRAQVATEDQRKAAALDPPYDKDTERILHWLDAGHLHPTDTRAAFDGRQVIREGWLRLSPNDQTTLP
jgi:hypothetical protein